MREVYVNFNETEGPMGFFMQYEEGLEHIKQSEMKGVCCDRCKLHIKRQILDFEVKKGDYVYIITDGWDRIDGVFKTHEEASIRAQKNGVF